MAASPKVPLPETVDDLIERYDALVAEFKRLTPQIVKTISPYAGLKEQRGVTKAWSESLHGELAQLGRKMKDSRKVFASAFEAAQQPAAQPEPQPAPAQEAPQEATTQEAAPATTQASGGKTTTRRSRAKKEPVAA